MGKKDPKVMAKQREAFLGGAAANGINEKKAVKLFEQIEHFAGYGFNKAHATAYALLAYRTAYLKANFPWHFAASLFTIEAQNTEKLAMYIAEARERDIPVLPPSFLALCEFCARYYQAPLGEVMAFALPPMLRRGKLPRRTGRLPNATRILCN